jgi:hypothetical protein
MGVPVPLLPRWMRYLGVAFVVGVVFYTSVLLTPPTTPILPVKPSLLPLDKWRHLLAYAAVAGSLVYATLDSDRPTHRLALAVVLVTVLYGVGIELVQSQIPNRYFSVADAYANAVGALLVTPVYLLRSRLRLVPVLAALATDRDQ